MGLTERINMKFNIIGAGRLGKNLAKSLINSNCGQLLAVYNPSLQRALSATQDIGTGRPIATLTELPPADVIFITTPDDQIAVIAHLLANLNTINPGTMVVHCSGVYGSEVLTSLQKQGCLIASIHPLRAFRADYLPPNAFTDCDCVVEGDELAVQLLTTQFSAMGAHVLRIIATKKALYHAAAVMASNYMVTLASCATTLFHDSGLSQSQAHTITQHLMQNSLSNLAATTHATQALTGPIARGDINTINAHLNAINTPYISALYKSAGLATLPLTQLNSEVRLALKKRLDNDD